MYTLPDGRVLLDDVSFRVGDGAKVALVGANGSGKTTLLRIIAGDVSPDGGAITGSGGIGVMRQFVGRGASDIHDLLLSVAPPRVRLAAAALDTAELAMMDHDDEATQMAYAHALTEWTDAGGYKAEVLWDAWFKGTRVRAKEKAVRHRADEVIEFLEISHVADEIAGNLSGGQKKLLELGRTMMVDAKVVFLDEVGAGVNRTLLNTSGDAIIRLNKERGYTFCMVEHDMDFIGRLCDPVIVMAEGKVLTIGHPTDVMKNEAVIEAYLGRGLKNKPPKAEVAP